DVDVAALLPGHHAAIRRDGDVTDVAPRSGQRSELGHPGATVHDHDPRDGDVALPFAQLGAVGHDVAGGGQGGAGDDVGDGGAGRVGRDPGEDAVVVDEGVGVAVAVVGGEVVGLGAEADHLGGVTADGGSGAVATARSAGGGHRHRRGGAVRGGIRGRRLGAARFRLVGTGAGDGEGQPRCGGGE